MHSGVRSKVHLMTANKPSTRVENHRAVSKRLNNVHEPVKDANFSTNEFLRKGGSLPSVLPVTKEFDARTPSSEHIRKKPKANQCNTAKRPMLRRTASFTMHTEKLGGHIFNRESPTHSDSEAHHHSSCQLEQKVEHLSEKISRVQDIILNQMNADAIITKTTTKNAEGFSARDYTLLVLEMNRNVPTNPYDPNDFSEK
ncbi:GDSL esterase/lipase [Frankliniella fusca]|uniref:GDSL esterase/lipase n=1 Tax=Frankliniella fusca TaxID=407009 RepID=A0AAE1GZN7_9NEOP|nr:GDSL esterase/lipase [Frankliniella fusca]